MMGTRPKKLLRTNTKLEKSTDKTDSYMLAGLNMAPHSLSGHNVCAEASDGCKEVCNLWWSGMRAFDSVRKSALETTAYYFEDRETFLKQLHRELRNLTRKAHKHGRVALVRLNMASDLVWTEVIKAHEDVTFYDYTKIRSRFEKYLAGELPTNYHLTFSAHEKHDQATIADFLRRGGNVAVVFDVHYRNRNDQNPLPEAYEFDDEYFPVVNGDAHDVRLPHIDGTGNIIGLHLKGASNETKQRARESGFAFECESNRAVFQLAAAAA